MLSTAKNCPFYGCKFGIKRFGISSNRFSFANENADTDVSAPIVVRCLALNLSRKNAEMIVTIYFHYRVLWNHPKEGNIAFFPLWHIRSMLYVFLRILPMTILENFRGIALKDLLGFFIALQLPKHPSSHIAVR